MYAAVEQQSLKVWVNRKKAGKCKYDFTYDPGINILYVCGQRICHQIRSEQKAAETLEIARNSENTLS